MNPATLVTDDDLRHWRACSRRWWLRLQGQPEGLAPQPSQGNAGPPQVSLSPAGSGLGAARPWGRSDAGPAGPDAEALTAQLASLPALPGPERNAPDPEALQGPAALDALRASFPGARVIAPPRTPQDWPLALQRTQAALADPRLQAPGGAVLGACLRSDDGALVRMDVLLHAERGWRLLKLRLATAGDAADVDTVALWAHVAARCGLRVAGMGLLLMDTDFVYPGHHLYAGLFREVDLGPMIGNRPVAHWLVEMRRLARGPLPEPSPGPQCGRPAACDFLAGCQHELSCAASAHPDVPPLALPASYLPGLPEADSLELVGRELAAELRAEGHHNLREVPLARLSQGRHRRVWQAVQQGGPVLDPAVAGALAPLAWPRYFLRLDTIGFAVPIWPGTRPYQVLPTQFGCDRVDADGTLRWQGFLADHRGDPRRALAEALLQALDQAPDSADASGGPVFAYNAGFERNRLRELAALWPDLAPGLEAVLARIVDLFQLARGHLYHPAQRGSWSFRALAQALAPELGAHEEACGGQPSAQAAFARSLQPTLADDERLALRLALQHQMQAQCALLRHLERCLAGADLSQRKAAHLSP